MATRLNARAPVTRERERLLTQEEAGAKPIINRRASAQKIDAMEAKQSRRVGAHLGMHVSGPSFVSSAGARALCVLAAAGTSAPACRVFVANVPFGCSEADLGVALEQQFGPVSSLQLAPDRTPGPSTHRGFGNAQFAEAAAAAAAVSAGQLRLPCPPGHPRAAEGWTVRIQPMKEQQVAPARPSRPRGEGGGQTKPSMPATRGALLHALKSSGDSATYRTARAQLGALQSTAEFSMAVAAAGRAGAAGAVRDLLSEMDGGGVPRDAWLYTAAITHSR